VFTTALRVRLRLLVAVSITSSEYYTGQSSMAEIDTY
jgi:hypothetical protein